MLLVILLIAIAIAGIFIPKKNRQALSSDCYVCGEPDAGKNHYMKHILSQQQPTINE